MVNLTIVAPRQAPGLTLTNMILTYFMSLFLMPTHVANKL